MEIKFKLEVSETSRSELVDISDLDITEDEWNNMPEDQQQKCLQDYVNDTLEYPYWWVTSFQEK